MPYRYYLWLIARLGVAVGLVAWAFSFIGPSRGEKEFARSLEAMKSISSVHYEMVADPDSSQHLEDKGDLVCADDTMHRIKYTDYRAQDQSQREGGEIIRIGLVEYKLHDNGLWKRGYANMGPNESPRETCQRMKDWGTSWFLPDYDRMAHHGVISKGERKVILGETCQEWKVMFLTGAASVSSSKQHRVVCLGEKDHLPREMSDEQTKGHWTYTFNSSPRIEPPTDLEPGIDEHTKRMDPGENLFGSPKQE